MASSASAAHATALFGPAAHNRELRALGTGQWDSVGRPFGHRVRSNGVHIGRLGRSTRRVGVRVAASPTSRSLVVMAADGNKKALLTVFDKSGLVDLAKGLDAQGYQLVSTGGTASAIEEAGLPVTRVEELTSFPEMLDGRVKTLHPAIHGGLLAKRSVKAHMDALDAQSIHTIDVMVGNLYPFYDTVTGGASFEDCVEKIDIGGPAMIRAAAKNLQDVLVVVDPDDYPLLLDALEQGNGSVASDDILRKKLAWKAFQHVASYDAAVAEWMWSQGPTPDDPAPAMSVPMNLALSLRYGENPHQKAAFYTDASVQEFNKGGVAGATQLHGKEMSYNNYLDADAAWSAVGDFKEPTCVVVKHTNPCGVASGTWLSDCFTPHPRGSWHSLCNRDDMLETYRQAVRADPVSAFGGIVAFNRPIDEELAREIREFRSPVDGESRMFYEIIICPGFTGEGFEVLKGKSKTLRILKAEPRGYGARSLRQVGGGWLLQDNDSIVPEELELKVSPWETLVRQACST
eukprot:scaffold3036_cov414-Prasinococcus_capsulatus_cf.AAC.24